MLRSRICSPFIVKMLVSNSVIFFFLIGGNVEWFDLLRVSQSVDRLQETANLTSRVLFCQLADSP